MSEKIEETELTIRLRKPIDGPAGPVDGFVLNEPTAGQILQWDGLEGAAADIMAISVVAGLPKAVVEKIPAREFYQAAKWIGSFLV
jgi:hypothetical protein